jgi:hypothetical protein
MNEPKKTFTMEVKDNRYAVWLIGEDNIPPDLKNDDGSTNKQQLINAISAMDITADSWKHDLTYNKEQKGWTIRLNERMRIGATTANWGPNKTPWFQAKVSRTYEEIEKCTMYLSGLAPGGAESADNMKAAITGWCQLKRAKVVSITLMKDTREEYKAKVVAETVEDKHKLLEKEFIYLMGDGVVVYDRKESEEQAKERMWKRTLQIAAVPMGFRAGELEEVRLWMGAEAVKVPANLTTGKRGDVAYFTFDSEAMADEYVGSTVVIKNTQRKVVRLFEKEGAIFKRVLCCWICGDPSHRKQECTQHRRGMITEGELLNYAAGMRMTVSKEKRLGEVIRNSAIKKRDIYKGNEMAYSAALKRAGVKVTEEGRAAARMVQPRNEVQTVSETPNAWKTQKTWGTVAQQNQTPATVTEQRVNDRLSKLEELLSVLVRDKTGGDEMAMDTESTGVTTENANSIGAKKRPRNESGEYEAPVERDWLQKALELEQKAKERSIYVDKQIGHLATEMGQLSQKVDSAFRALMASADDTSTTTDKILRALVDKGIMKMDKEAVGTLHVVNTDSAQSGSQHLGDVGQHQ